MDQAGKHILYAKVALILGLKKLSIRHMEKADTILVNRTLRIHHLGE